MSIGHRTKAERRVDALAAEARKLRQIPSPSVQQRNRLWEIQTRKLPSAWRAVREQRGELR